MRHSRTDLTPPGGTKSAHHAGAGTAGHFHADIPSSDLAEKPLGQPSAEPLTGEILTRSQVFFDEPQITSGTWECEPGSSRWEFTTRGEIIYVLSGRMTVEQDGGTPVELTAGSSCIFPIGWCGVWTVHETLRKVFVVYRPTTS